ncbi:MAG: hypothetical protein JWO13_2289 [Acidobacteriales bacterium]|nr:hypothetical protein [Terriglobales bacterium]
MRDLTAGVKAEVVKDRIIPVFFVEATFVSGVVRLWTGLGQIVWNGQTWQGVMTTDGKMLGAISELEESTTVEAKGMTLSLTGVPNTSLQQAMNECRPNFPVTVYVALGDLDTQQILNNPYKAWAGKMDVPSALVGTETCTVSITVESRMIALQRSRNWRMTHEDQQIFHPGDDGFKFVGGLQNAVINVGKGSPNGPQPFVPVPVNKG